MLAGVSLPKTQGPTSQTKCGSKCSRARRSSILSKSMRPFVTACRRRPGSALCRVSPNTLHLPHSTTSMHTYISTAIAACAILCIPTFAADSAPRSLPYRSDFEAPAFTEGSFARKADSLDTKNAYWSLFTNGQGADLPNLARIQRGTVRAGTLALRIDASAARAVQSGVSTTIENHAQLITIEADVFLKSSKQQTTWQFAAGDPGVGFVGGINLAADDRQLQLITARYPQKPTTITRDVWSHYKMVFDLLTQTYDVSINDTVVVSHVPFVATAKQLQTFQFATFAKGDDAAFLDNFAMFSGASNIPTPPLPAGLPSKEPTTPTVTDKSSASRQIRLPVDARKRTRNLWHQA